MLSHGFKKTKEKEGSGVGGGGGVEVPREELFQSRIISTKSLLRISGTSL